jgi:hypothetical protein
MAVDIYVDGVCFYAVNYLWQCAFFAALIDTPMAAWRQF